jgi:hypothetical protein
MLQAQKCQPFRSNCKNALQLDAELEFVSEKVFTGFLLALKR